MIVEEVIRIASTYLGLTDLLQTSLLGGSAEATDEQIVEINTMITCCNLAVNQVASEYLTLKNKTKISSDTGVIYYSRVSSNVIVDILNVKQNGINVSFDLKTDRLETVGGEVEIEYAYQPKMNMSLSSNINFNNFKLNSRVLAYGVSAEYCFINGRYDDAAVWENRFTTSLTNINRPRREVKVKERLWI